MSQYTAPLNDLLFNLEHIAQLDPLSRTIPAFADANLETAAAVLDESAKLTQNILAPLNALGDRHPPTLNQGQVTTSPGFKQAFEQFVQGGWQGLQHPVFYGGQGLPKSIGAACFEMLNSANLSFALCPMLTDATIEALLIVGTAEQKDRYLPQLLSGKWTGTMNLTEAQAGSDLSLIRTRAEPQPDGRFKLYGTKIYITYGEHDYTDNILHLVLARIQGALDGIKGLSLFLVPKWLVQLDGSLGERNDVVCLSLEHKLGIHASPTAVLQFGDQGGAVAELVGEPNKGLETMFIMMNAARFAVGVQGVGLAERAYQQAVQYAKDRVQSRPIDGSALNSVAIIQHPDVRRMLMHMRALIQSGRALAIFAASQHDLGQHHPDATQRATYQTLYEYLVPVVKGYCTENSQIVTRLAIQVHGGMGFIEETGVAQHDRDAKILTIYEGTTAIQANDLLSRKTWRDQGLAARVLLTQVWATLTALHTSEHPQAPLIAQSLGSAHQAFTQVVDFMLQNSKTTPELDYAGSVSYLMLVGYTLSGWQLAHSFLIATQQISQHPVGSAFLKTKMTTAVYFAQHILPQVKVLADAIQLGGGSILELPLDAF